MNVLFWRLSRRLGAGSASAEHAAVDFLKAARCGPSSRVENQTHQALPKLTAEKIACTGSARATAAGGRATAGGCARRWPSAGDRRLPLATRQRLCARRAMSHHAAAAGRAVGRPHCSRPGLGRARLGSLAQPRRLPHAPFHAPPTTVTAVAMPRRCAARRRLPIPRQWLQRSARPAGATPPPAMVILYLTQGWSVRDGGNMFL